MVSPGQVNCEVDGVRDRVDGAEEVKRRAGWKDGDFLARARGKGEVVKGF
ncbi:MAG: hypothetical protein V2G33_04200 [bacterium JZ-2024 1]